MSAIAQQFISGNVLPGVGCTARFPCSSGRTVCAQKLCVTDLQAAQLQAQEISTEQLTARHSLHAAHLAVGPLLPVSAPHFPAGNALSVNGSALFQSPRATQPALVVGGPLVLLAEHGSASRLVAPNTPDRGGPLVLDVAYDNRARCSRNADQKPDYYRALGPGTTAEVKVASVLVHSLAPSSSLGWLETQTLPADGAEALVLQTLRTLPGGEGPEAQSGTWVRHSAEDAWSSWSQLSAAEVP